MCQPVLGGVSAGVGRCVCGVGRCWVGSGGGLWVLGVVRVGGAALPRGLEGESAVVVGDAEVGEAQQVDGCCSVGEP